jgi:L-ascorbate metabolism protein UlaG (beta-lactamase superfamily)
MGDKVPFVIDGPGSYESKGLFFTGIESKVLIDEKEYINTIYGFELDAIKIAFMGIVSDSAPLSLEAKELLSNADMVFIPIGGAPSFDAATAYKTATSFDPNVIIPYEYDKPSLSHFLKEGGQEKNDILDKATLKRRDLDGKEAQIIVLASQA